MFPSENIVPYRTVLILADSDTFLKNKSPGKKKKQVPSSGKLLFFLFFCTFSHFLLLLLFPYVLFFIYRFFFLFLLPPHRLRAAAPEHHFAVAERPCNRAENIRCPCVSWDIMPLRSCVVFRISAIFSAILSNLSVFPSMRAGYPAGQLSCGDPAACRSCACRRRARARVSRGRA